MSTRVIKINRGDSYEFTLMIPSKSDPNKPYLLSSEDSFDAVYFALMYPNQRFEDAIFIKGYESNEQNPKTGEITIKIEPNDTRVLTPGVYYYVVKLQRGGTLEVVDDFDDAKEVRTIIDRTKFIINE